jgi:hypothetical protein
VEELVEKKIKNKFKQKSKSAKGRIIPEIASTV